jgi:hypothetical protein
MLKTLGRILAYHHRLGPSFVGRERYLVRPDAVIVPQKGGFQKLKDLGGGIVF